ncbi:GNAT family N-acetyltransferase [Lysinibacillus sp. NPDC092081]|uniref:GNAT family N-acetyltransferase n=1 Tax=Lysinibacillus sp. NPDC092081 TaxID=3364131 RepID=UPI00381DEBDC
MQNTIRTLTPEDIEQASKVFTSVFNAAPWNEPWSLQTSYKRLLDISMTPGYIGIGYFHSDGQMNGFLVGNEEQWADSKSFYINEICVLNNIQQNGVGSNLLKHLEDILIKEKVEAVYLSTERGKGKPELFFKKNGFETNESRILMKMNLN